jgi:hypothetical protein
MDGGGRVMLKGNLFYNDKERAKKVQTSIEFRIIGLKKFKKNCN